MDLELFQTRVGVYHNIELAEKYTPLFDEYLNVASSMMGIKDHYTTYNDPTLGQKLNNDRRFDEIFNWCVQTALQCFWERGYDVNKFNVKPYFFVNHIKKGSYFHRHAHPNAKISGVFYLDASPDNSSIIFHDPRPYKQCISLPMRNDFTGYTEEYHMEVETGKLLIWDAWLEHEVPQNTSDHPRKTLVFNL